MNAGALVRHPSRVLALARKELAVGNDLHGEVQATLERMDRRSRGFAVRRAKAYGYAVFPSVAHAGAVLGASYGLGEVYELRRLVGYAGLVQVTLGVQLGGQTAAHVFFFENRGALQTFRRSGVHGTAAASVVLVKAGAHAVTGRHGMRAASRSNGGLMLEAAVGLRLLKFAPAVLTRGRSPGTSLRIVKPRRGKAAARAA